jgi:Leucine-rich repeat (LRR) protein
MFNDLFLLTYLDLSSNQISSINLLSFNGLNSLENLYLVDNKLTHISENIFKNLVELKYLNLKSNDIVAFNKDLLFGLYWLETICLYGNPISIQFPHLLDSICPSKLNPKYK